MSLRASLSEYQAAFQGELFPALEEALGPLPERYGRFVQVLEFVLVDAVVLPAWPGGPGRPPEDRRALARAFLAKAVFDVPTTRALIERLQIDRTLRRLCGWTRAGAVPSEATFSRAFAAFAMSGLPERLHAVLVAKTLGHRLVGHISRDATAIPARERATPKPAKPKRRRGRPRKGEQRPPRRRLERQQTMTLSEMLADLPRACDVGTKRNAKGYKESWTGYKLHIDAADGGVPVSCILTSASLHDSQVALPLAHLTAGRVTNLYDLMDSAYDAKEIRTCSKELGHVPIIDPNPRTRARKLALEAEARARRVANRLPADRRRLQERTNVERVNGRLKDECGGRRIHVRGPVKVMTHLMFGICVLSVDQLIRLLH